MGLKFKNIISFVINGNLLQPIMSGEGSPVDRNLNPTLGLLQNMNSINEPAVI